MTNSVEISTDAVRWKKLPPGATYDAGFGATGVRGSSNGSAGRYIAYDVFAGQGRFVGIGRNVIQSSYSTADTFRDKDFSFWTVGKEADRGLDIWDAAYGNGTLVAVGAKGARGIIAYSTDGASWKLAEDKDKIFEGKNFRINAVCYGGGKWAAIASDVLNEDAVNAGREKNYAYADTVFTSTDGIRWKKEAAISQELFEGNRRNMYRPITSIAWGAGVWVIVGQDIVAWSSDLVSWTKQMYTGHDGKPARCGAETVIYGGGRFVIGGMTGYPQNYGFYYSNKLE